MSQDQNPPSQPSHAQPALASLLLKGRTGKDRPSAMPGIYAIVVSKGHERPIVYIGKSSNTSMRWARHRKDMREGKHHHKVLQEAWPDDVHFYVLEYTFDIHIREVFWIDFISMLKCNIINERRG